MRHKKMIVEKTVNYMFNLLKICEDIKLDWAEMNVDELATELHTILKNFSTSESFIEFREDCHNAIFKALDK
jgi:hypothetical protein